jgi:hypothetical protein
MNQYILVEIRKLHKLHELMTSIDGVKVM